MRFKPGQKVVCIKRDGWIWSKSKTPAPNDGGFPKFNEIVTVQFHESVTHITLVEFPVWDDLYHKFRSYHIKNFEPLISDEQLEEELKAIHEPQTI